MIVERSLDYDVVIVGGGIVGLTLACALKNSELRIAVVEAQPTAIATSKGQAYAISLLSSRIFQGMGVWESIRPGIAAFQQIQLSDADYPRVVRFLPQDLNTPELGYVAEHGVLLNALQHFRQQHCPEVDWLCPAEVRHVSYSTHHAEVTLKRGQQEQVLQTQLIVAADGARSPLRQQAGIRTHGWQYWQSCIVCTVRPEHPHPKVAYERFWPSGPFAILPLPDNRCRIVWTAPHAEAKALMELAEKPFLQELQQRYGDHMGALQLEGGRFLFPVRLMHSDRYTLPRLALIGDAAHCCHPVGGQGLNLGIRDAAALAQVLQKAHQRQEDLGDWAVLRRYEQWRKWETLMILGMTDFLDRCFSNTWLPLVLLRRLGLWLLRYLLPFRVLALRLMTGLTGRSPELARSDS